MPSTDATKQTGQCNTPITESRQQVAYHLICCRTWETCCMRGRSVVKNWEGRGATAPRLVGVKRMRMSPAVLLLLLHRRISMWVLPLQRWRAGRAIACPASLVDVGRSAGCVTSQPILCSFQHAFAGDGWGHKLLRRWGHCTSKKATRCGRLVQDGTCRIGVSVSQVGSLSKSCANFHGRVLWVCRYFA